MVKPRWAKSPPQPRSICRVLVMKPLKLYHVVAGVTTNDTNTCVVLFATTESKDHQSTEAQHGELEEIHCASSLGGKSSSIAACQCINSPCKVL